MVKNPFAMFAAFIIATLITLTLAIPVTLFQFFRTLYRRESMAEFWRFYALAQDRLWGAVLYKQWRWTVSSYTYTLSLDQMNRAAYFFNKFLNLVLGKGHTKASYEWEKGIKGYD